MKKFRDMTDSEKLEIIKALEEGKLFLRGVVDKDFKFVQASCIALDGHYRIEKTPMSIDWSVLKDEYICAARDAAGAPYGYTQEPKAEYAQWMITNSATSAIPLRGLKSYDPGTVEWQDSLIWRPGFEPKGE